MEEFHRLGDRLSATSITSMSWVGHIFITMTIAGIAIIIITVVKVAVGMILWVLRAGCDHLGGIIIDPSEVNWKRGDDE